MLFSAQALFLCSIYCMWKSLINVRLEIFPTYYYYISAKLHLRKCFSKSRTPPTWTHACEPNPILQNDRFKCRYNNNMSGNKKKMAIFILHNTAIYCHQRTKSISKIPMYEYNICITIENVILCKYVILVFIFLKYVWFCVPTKHNLYNTCILYKIILHINT